MSFMVHRKAKKILTLEDLNAPDPKLDSASLEERFEKSWNKCMRVSNVLSAIAETT